MRIEKSINKGVKACIGGFEVDQADNCKWRTTSTKYLTEIPDFESDGIITIESPMGSIGHMEFICKTSSALYKSIKKGKINIVLYGDIGSYPKDGLDVYIETIYRREIGNDTEVSLLFK